jgi:hypothetical protein
MIICESEESLREIGARDSTPTTTSMPAHSIILPSRASISTECEKLKVSDSPTKGSHPRSHPNEGPAKGPAPCPAPLSSMGSLGYNSEGLACNTVYTGIRKHGPTVLFESELLKLNTQKPAERL